MTAAAFWLLLLPQSLAAVCLMSGGEGWRRSYGVQPSVILPVLPLAAALAAAGGKGE